MLAYAATLKVVSDVDNAEDDATFWRWKYLEASGGGVFLPMGSA